MLSVIQNESSNRFRFNEEMGKGGIQLCDQKPMELIITVKCFPYNTFIFTCNNKENTGLKFLNAWDCARSV